MNEFLMDDRPTVLQPAEALVRKSKTSQPNESAEYRKARSELLIEEIESKTASSLSSSIGEARPIKDHQATRFKGVHVDGRSGSQANSRKRIEASCAAII